MPRIGSPYGREHQRERRAVLDEVVACVHCGLRPATELDHDPPLVLHPHRNGSGCCQRVPSCAPCARSQGGILATAPRIPVGTPEPDEPAEPVGFAADHPCWSVPWLDRLRQVPPEAVWPRLMTVPHPLAAGSLGDEFARWCEKRTGRPLRWWQRLVSTRLLEVDQAERLVWETLVLSLARQLGKSWWLRELFLWRIHQGERFGEEQLALHTGKDLAICKEVQRPARVWAKARPDLYRVREVNGQEEIEYRVDGSRWMLRAKEAVYGYAASLAGADEAWKVAASSVEEGLTPTMAEREQAQLILVSTAHRLATALMLGRRATALGELGAPTGDLLVEWSAPRDLPLDDMAGWRLASPHWTERRSRLIGKRLTAAVAGESDDPDEPDPIESFRAQWLNQWPHRVAHLARGVELLLPEGTWAARSERISAPGPVWVALEDNRGFGAAVGVAARLPDGRLEVDGWLCASWDQAIADARRLADERTCRQFLVGASLLDRVPQGWTPRPERVGSTEVRTGLPLLRDLVASGGLVHDTNTTDLDVELTAARVRNNGSGLNLLPEGASHLVRAVAWAVQAADKPRPAPAVH